MSLSLYFVGCLLMYISKEKSYFQKFGKQDFGKKNK